MNLPAIRPGAFRSIMDSASESLYSAHMSRLSIEKAMYALERSEFSPQNPDRNKTLYSMEIARKRFIDLASSPTQTIITFSISISRFTLSSYGFSSLNEMLTDQYVSIPQPILTVLQGLGIFGEVVAGDESARWMDIPDSLDEIDYAQISGIPMTWDWIGSIGIAG